MAKLDPADAYIVYGGDSSQKRSRGHVISWNKVGTLIATLESPQERLKHQ